MACVSSICFPEAFEANSRAGLWVIGGFLVQIGLEYLSKGMEHGHVHGNRFGTLAFLSLCLHAFIEAMPFGLKILASTSMTTMDTPWAPSSPCWRKRMGLLFGIGLHKLPVAIALMTILECHRDVPGAPLDVGHRVYGGPLFSASFSREPCRRTPPHSAHWNGLLVGILLHIATIILFETADGHEFNGRKFPTVLLGLALSLMTTHL